MATPAAPIASGAPLACMRCVLAAAAPECAACLAADELGDCDLLYGCPTCEAVDCADLALILAPLRRQLGLPPPPSV